jgi:hypothetical protein
MCFKNGLGIQAGQRHGGIVSDKRAGIGSDNHLCLLEATPGAGHIFKFLESRTRDADTQSRRILQCLLYVGRSMPNGIIHR